MRKKRLTPYEIYELLVGAAGHPRHFILYEARLWDIRSLLRGYYRRHRPIFEAARIPAFVAAGIGGSKAHTMQDFMCFSWEQAERDARIKREAIEAAEILRQMKEQQHNN